MIEIELYISRKFPEIQTYFHLFKFQESILESEKSSIDWR